MCVFILKDMVEVDATTLVAGNVLLTISTTDRDGDTDQRTLTVTSCTPSCPFTILDCKLFYQTY
jgi:hypothetical protein